MSSKTLSRCRSRLDDPVAAWADLADLEPGITAEQAAARLGTTKAALEKVIARARQAGDPRIPDAAPPTTCPDECRSCHRPMLPGGRPRRPGQVVHASHGLCRGCTDYTIPDQALTSPTTDTTPAARQPTGWGPDLVPRALRLHADQLTVDGEEHLADRLYRRADLIDAGKRLQAA